MERGIEKGIEKGMGQALSKTVLKLLTKKFGPVPAEVREKLIKLDALTLEIIVENIFDYEILGDIRKYI